MALSTPTTATTVTPAATAAAAMVFATVELLEMILEHTDFRDLLRAQRVNKNFHDVIKDSTRLQRCMAWLDIENPKVMHTPLSFQLHFKAHNGHSSFSMRHSPFYSNNDDGQGRALLLQFHGFNEAPRGFSISPQSSGSWRNIRVTSVDQRTLVLSSMWATLPSSATLGDVYDELCRQQKLAREHWKNHEAHGGYVGASKASDLALRFR